MIDKVSLDKFITGEGDDEKVKEKERIIQKLKDAGYEVKSKSHTLPDIKGLFKEVNRKEKENG